MCFDVPLVLRPCGRWSDLPVFRCSAVCFVRLGCGGGRRFCSVLVVPSRTEPFDLSYLYILDFGPNLRHTRLNHCGGLDVYFSSRAVGLVAFRNVFNMVVPTEPVRSKIS